VRFVSVVVPDWLIATTSVSLMSVRRPNPESSVASIASTRSSVSPVIPRSAATKL